MFREEYQKFLSQIKINNSVAIDVEERTRGQSSNPEWFNIGLEESQHQSLVKSTIAGQQLHQIALSETYFNTEQGQPHHFSVLKDSDLNQ